MNLEKRALVGMSLPEMTQFLEEMGEPRFRGKQLFQWVYQKGVKSFAEMTNLSVPLRDKLEQHAQLVLMEAETVQHDAETSKYLFRLLDGEKVECVLMRHNYGNSVCLTTQVGCRMGCTFCASTFGGLVRNLTAGEIVDQVLMIQRDLPQGERVSSVVFMGTGEPMDNYDEVLKAVRLLHDPNGVNMGYRHMTISTSGVVPGMRRLAEEGLPVTLALSLHAPNDALRSQLMPIGRKWPLGSVLQAAKEYGEKTGRRVTYEYILIKGVNDRPEHADELGQMLKGSLAHVNLIPLNPVDERPHYQRPPWQRVQAFLDILGRHGVTATVRREMGGEIDAACGQLRNRQVRRRNASRS